MVINGKEYGFFYSVWAYCEFNDWVVKNPKASLASAMIQRAVIMSKAYADVNGGGPVLNAKEIMNLPKYVFDEIIAETDRAEKRDSERTVESAPSAKNGRSSEK